MADSSETEEEQLSSASAGAPDYRAVTVPKGTDPADFNYNQRRAQILRFIEEAGHPQALNKSELGRRYDVSHTTIGNDFDRLRSYILDNIDTEQVDMISQVGFQQSIKKLQEQERPKDAAKVIKWWNDWLFDRGKVRKEPEQHKHDHDHEVDPGEQYMRMLEEAGDEGGAAAVVEGTSPTSDVIEVAAEQVCEDDDQEAAGEEEGGTPLAPPEPDGDYPAAGDDTAEDDDDAEEGATDADGDADSGGGSGDSNDTDGADDAATIDADREEDVAAAGDGWQRASGGGSDDWDGATDGDDDLDGGEGMSGAERGRRRSDSSNFGKSPEERRKDYHDRREWS